MLHSPKKTHVALEVCNQALLGRDRSVSHTFGVAELLASHYNINENLSKEIL